MADYTQITDFGAKDALASADPEKIILGEDVDAELEAIAAAIATKFDSANDGAGSGLDADSVDGVGPFDTGAYTPTFTEVSNLDSIAANGNSMHVRIGNIVIASGSFTANITDTGSSAQFRISLPVASEFTTESHLAGIFQASVGSAVLSGTILADATNDEALVTIFSSSSSNIEARYFIMYRVLS